MAVFLFIFLIVIYHVNCNASICFLDAGCFRYFVLHLFPHLKHNVHTVSGKPVSGCRIMQCIRTSVCDSVSAYEVLLVGCNGLLAGNICVVF